MMSGKTEESIVRVRVLRRCRGGRRLRAGYGDSRWLAPGFLRSKLDGVMHLHSFAQKHVSVSNAQSTHLCNE